MIQGISTRIHTWRFTKNAPVCGTPRPRESLESRELLLGLLLRVFGCFGTRLGLRDRRLRLLAPLLLRLDVLMRLRDRRPRSLRLRHG